MREREREKERKREREKEKENELPCVGVYLEPSVRACVCILSLGTFLVGAYFFKDTKLLFRV